MKIGMYIVAFLMVLGVASKSIVALAAMEPGQHAEQVSLGTTKIGKYEVEAIQEGKVVAGKEATFGVKLRGEGEPTAIRAWIGIESARGSAKGKAHKHGDEIEVHCDVPETIPADAKLWIEIETADGKARGSFAYKA